MRRFLGILTLLITAVSLQAYSLSVTINVLSGDPVVGVEVTFQGSYSPSGIIALFEWAIDGAWGYSFGNDHLEHTFASIGTHTVSFMVHDHGTGSWKTKTITITVREASHLVGLSWTSFERHKMSPAETVLREARDESFHSNIRIMHLGGTTYFVHQLSSDYLAQLGTANVFAVSSQVEQLLFINVDTGLPELDPSTVRQLAMLFRSESYLQNDDNVYSWKDVRRVSSSQLLEHFAQSLIWKGGELTAAFSFGCLTGSSGLVAALKTGIGAIVAEIASGDSSLNDITREMTYAALTNARDSAQDAIRVHDYGRSPSGLSRVGIATSANVWQNSISSLYKLDQELWSGLLVAEDFLESITIGTVKRLIGSVVGGGLGDGVVEEYAISLGTTIGLTAAQQAILESPNAQRLNKVMDDLANSVGHLAIPEVPAINNLAGLALQALSLAHIYTEQAADYANWAERATQVQNVNASASLGATAILISEAVESANIASKNRALAADLISQLEQWVARLLPPDLSGFEAAGLEIANRFDPSDFSD